MDVDAEIAQPQVLLDRRDRALRDVRARAGERDARPRRVARCLGQRVERIVEQDDRRARIAFGGQHFVVIRISARKRPAKHLPGWRDAVAQHVAQDALTINGHIDRAADHRGRQ